MAERIQLKDPGSELVMKVGSVKPETVEKNDYWLFSNGSKELLVPQSSITAQLSRLEIHGATDLIGQTVRFGRSMKMSRANKPYWDIDIVSGAEAPSQSDRAHGVEFRVPINSSAGGEGIAGKSASAPPVEPSTDERDKALLAQRAVYATRMKQSVAYVLENIEPLYKAKGIGMSDDGVYKHAYSIWREWCERGIIQ